MKSGAKRYSKQIKRKLKALKSANEDSSSIAEPAKKPKVEKPKHSKLKHKKEKNIDSSKEDVTDLEKMSDIIGYIGHKEEQNTKNLTHFIDRNKEQGQDYSLVEKSIINNQDTTSI